MSNYERIEVSTLAQKRKLATVSTSSQMRDLDYKVFPVYDSSPCCPNRVAIPSEGGNSQRVLEVKEIMREPQNVPILAVTATTGCVKGTILTNPWHLKMPGFCGFQEM